MSPFTVLVKYQLREYISIICDFAQYAGKTKRRSELVHPLSRQEKKIGVLTKAGLAIVATPIFFYKVFRVGACEFSFTENGLTRKSKGVTLDVSWRDIQYAYVLSEAFLFAKAVGALPVPYRCLSNAQRECLGGVVNRLNSAAHAAQLSNQSGQTLTPA